MGAGYDIPRWRKVTLTTNGCSKPKHCLHPKNTASFKDRAAHGGGVRSNNQTSAYAQIEKEFFWFTENKNSLIYTKYTCIYMHQNICLYIIHVHTTDNVRPKQWPHALSNKLQVFYENSMGFRTPAVGQSYWSIYAPYSVVVLLLHSEILHDRSEQEPIWLPRNATEHFGNGSVPNCKSDLYHSYKSSSKTWYLYRSETDMCVLIWYSPGATNSVQKVWRLAGAVANVLFLLSIKLN